MAPVKVTRRGLLLFGAVGGAGLALGFVLTRRRGTAPRADTDGVSPNALLAIEPDGEVNVWVPKSEMGQGVLTSLPMLVAAELGADWSRVRARQPLADWARYGDQGTYQSTSVKSRWTELRRAGAAAREMLTAAAAARWDVPVRECRSQGGFITHEPSGRTLEHGELAREAARLDVPEDPALRPESELELLGTSPTRLDTPSKVDGSAQFGCDVRLPGMLYASIERSPGFGGRIAHPFSYAASLEVDDAAARAVPGVLDVVRLDTGVAVVAESTWAALQGRRALDVEWERHPEANSAHFAARLDELSATDGTPARGEHALGRDVPASEAGFPTLRLVFHLPYLAHATMEPMNCTADHRGAECEVWAPTQNPLSVRDMAARYGELDAAQVTVHTTLLGGGFGRRAEWEYAVEAVQLSRAVRRPVQVFWTREDDMRHDFYRPAACHVVEARCDADGLARWSHRIVSPSIVAQRGGDVSREVDPTAVEGAVEFPYAAGSVRVEHVVADLPVPVGFWRSVGHSHNAFAVECAIDELAEAAGSDPVAFRRRLLRTSPRHLGVLERVVAEAGWGQPLPAGTHRGVAVHASFGSYVAMVAEVRVEAQGTIRVPRVVAAVDCGRIVHPDTIRAQIEGGVVFGLTAALHGRITIEDGGVVEGNFHDYELLRIDAAPEVLVHIVESGEEPGGVGEIGVPPIAPAVAGGIFAATGRRMRSLPFELG